MQHVSLSHPDRPAEIWFPGPARGGLTPVLLPCFGDEGRAVAEAIRSLGGADCALVCVSGPDWEGDLSPWPAPGLRRGGPDFPGGADRFLDELTGGILPRARRELDAPDAPAVLAGYSFAGLFALYALWKTDAFRRAVSASGSLWYPGFLDFAASHPTAGTPEGVYLSLGDAESRARHPVLRTVGEATGAMFALLRRLGIPCTLESNPGNHFRDEALRTAKGVVWALGRGPRP